MGVNPDGLTLRELVWMSEGRGRSEWAQTAQILCLVANVNRPSGKAAYKVEDFYPYAEKKRVPIEILKGFVKR